MGLNTEIEWADHTWNPWTGCTKVSSGCENCYMFRGKNRWGQNPNEVKRSSDSTFLAPLKKNWESGSRIFVCSWSDFFHKDADKWRDEAWDIIRKRPDLIFMILTKRPENIADGLPRDWEDGWSNVWLGITAEDQFNANWRIPELIRVNAAVKFVSCEPLLSDIDLSRINYRGGWILDTLKHIDWVICGGESGPNFREMDINWARHLRDHCVGAKVPFFFKQYSGVYPKRLGRILDGKEWNELPNQND